MNGLDLFIIIILGLVALKGYRKGLLRIFTSLVSIFFAGILCAKASMYIEPYLVTYFDTTPQVIRTASIIISFTLVLVAIRYIGRSLSRLIKNTSLGGINKILGGVLAPIAVSFLLSYLFLFADQVFPLTKKDADYNKDIRVKSALYSPIKNLVPKYIAFDWKDLISETSEHFKKSRSDNS